MFKIITVDDEKMIKRSLRVMIEGANPDFRIVGEAKNGQEAMDIIHGDPPHLLITDICMPIMDGLELIAEVKRNYSHTQIIVISGYSEFNYAQQALRYNVTDYLLKPIDPEEFKQVLKKIYEQHISNEQRSIDRREQMWKIVDNGEQIVNWIWTLQENHLRSKLEAIRTELELLCIETDLVRDIYRDLLIYTTNRLGERSGRSYPHTMASEPGPTPSMKELHDQFQGASMSLFKEIVHLRNWGQSQHMKKTIDYIQANFSNSEISLLHMAEYASMSISYFSRFFKEETGTSFMKYLTNLRIGKAKELLAIQEHKVGDVALMVGYTNYHHFAKAFKKFTGITPTEYRQMHEERVL
ncbi:response regulator transcription factor [Paenibacillus mendelii]|uniref:Response regulator n=1 Tax=Paenibacillus mendelii TaxID=206163 RepID=A0ABV6J6Z7_9BACL|nr:response regulator [Paenibacillus mendelii]MCQ6560973.1 response regulator [Paenibacillus mendelii]